MKIKDIKNKLLKHNLRVWQLMKTLGISRSVYYRLSHNDFKGYEKRIKGGINELINKKDAVKNDD